MDAGHISLSERAPEEVGQISAGKAEFAVPGYVIWELAPRCNTNSGHCHMSADPPQPMKPEAAEAGADPDEAEADPAQVENGLANADLTIAESLALIAELAASGVSTVVFAGEPPVRADWQRLVQHARRHGLVVELKKTARDPDACRRDGLMPRICPDGTVTPCAFSMTRIGSLRRHSLRHIWTHSPLVAQLRTRHRTNPTTCTACEHRQRSARMNAVARRALLMGYESDDYRSLHPHAAAS